MLTEMRASLVDASVNVGHEVAKKSLVLSSETTVSASGSFDADLMMQQLEDAIDQALKDGYKGLFAAGDMTWELGSKESFSKLLGYEWRLERLFHKRPELCGVCMYNSSTLPFDIMRKGLLSHQKVFINETLSLLNEHYAQSEGHAEEASANSELDETITGLLQT